jgi:deoxyribonuclease-1
LLLVCNPHVPAQDTAENYDYVVQELFWKQLYLEGGWTLYCGYRFDPSGRSPDNYGISIDHVYATEWTQDYLGCGNRSECRNGGNKKFLEMEADLHNLYPAWSALLVYRSGRMFGEVAGEDSRFDDCDFEWKGEVVEPRDISRGNVARSILYMHDRYGAPVSADVLERMKKWNRDDPPSEQEVVRNDRIEKLQGRRNPYIDNPRLADKIPIPKNR